jgi:hypothetical protein
MNRPDQPESTTESTEEVNGAPLAKPHRDSTRTALSSASQSQESSFDWTALGVVILIAAFFAITARHNAQPATSFVPAAVLSATGCGLLVTAIRTLHTSKGIGLLEAALGGFFMALFQFTVAITYPGVFDSISFGQTLQDDFLITWILITGFSIIFSLVGATLGHLSFAPPRSFLDKSSSTAGIEEKDFDTTQDEQSVHYAEIEEEAVNTVSRKEEEDNIVGTGDQDIQIEDSSEAPSSKQSQRSIISYFFTILLLGLAPTVVAYVFSAAYDFTLSFNQFVPGPYPTLRMLSALLPWQIPIPIDLSSNIGNIIIFSLLWRIPLFLGNPSLFDLQALEPYIYNGAAFALLLLTMYRQNASTANQSSHPGWVAYLSMEAALGLVMVLPANLWVLRGLEGLLQFHDIVIPIRTISILNPLTFSLNLITGPLVCVGLGIALRIFLSKRTVTIINC